MSYVSRNGPPEALLGKGVGIEGGFGDWRCINCIRRSERQGRPFWDKVTAKG